MSVFSNFSMLPVLPVWLVFCLRTLVKVDIELRFVEGVSSLDVVIKSKAMRLPFVSSP